VEWVTKRSIKLQVNVKYGNERATEIGTVGRTGWGRTRKLGEFETSNEKCLRKIDKLAIG